MVEMQVVGKRLPRPDALEKVRGQAQFAADIQIPGELVAKFLPSPHAHAEILSIDTSKAEALPGIYAVVTAADIPDVETYDANSRFHAFMARRFIVFVGQPVVAVAADNLSTAEEALSLIEVEYRLLPVINTIEDALALDAVSVKHSDQKVLWSTGGGHNQTAASASKESSEKEPEDGPNIADKIVFKYGDLEAAFAESDVIVEGTYTVPVVHQGYIEPHAVTAYWDRPDHVTVWECVQGSFAARDLIAHTLGIPQTSITLNATEIGGGFGGKVEGIFSPIAVLLARKTRRPVKLILNRTEEFLGANPAPNTLIRIKTGAKKDGTLTAIEADIKLDAGAFPTGWIMSAVALGMGGTYNFAAWRLSTMEVVTNKASAAAYRAPGGPNASFAIESQIDEMSHRLGFDPVDFRLMNLQQEGDMMANAQPQTRVGSREVLEALVDHGSWPPQAEAYQDEEGLMHGYGVALGGWEGGTGPASALAILEADGRFRIVLGTLDLTGSYTSLAQIAAETLGVSVDQVVMSKASPDHAPFAPMSAGSQTIYAMGAAIVDAANDLKTKILEQASISKNLSAEELAIDDQGVYVIAKPDSRMSFEHLFQLGSEWFATTGPMIGIGSAKQRKRAPGFAASVAEIAVDIETGMVKLLKLVTSQDAGKAINPLAVEGQIQGGSTQSAGFALWEELMYAPDGQVRNPNLLDYRIATAADMPMIESIIVEVPGGDGPYGAKIVGEPSIVPPVAAIANAVAAAIGVRMFDLPITPERIWRALEAKQEGVPE